MDRRGVRVRRAQDAIAERTTAPAFATPPCSTISTCEVCPAPAPSGRRLRGVCGRLLDRNIATLIACWEENARGAPGAAVTRLPGVDVAVFPGGVERAVFNNAVLAPHLSPAACRAAIEAMERTYAEAGVEDYAAWVHESDDIGRRELARCGYTLSETTRAMGMWLDDLAATRPTIDLAPPDWHEYLRILGLPGLLDGADRDAYHVLVARLDGAPVATAMAFDHGGDCGVFNVTTMDGARRRGLGTAVTAHHLHDARARGCRSASLQSSEMAERVYAAVGFRDLGHFLEFAPPK